MDINKDASNLQVFKNKIRKLEPRKCYCNLCSSYISNLVFVNLMKSRFN